MTGARRRYVRLGDGRRVRLGVYVAGIKLAKANPSITFKSGLCNDWWGATGAEIVRQFFEGVTDRINEAIPYTQRGFT